MPLRMPAIPCSRMPKWRLRPAGAASLKTGGPFTAVRVDPGRCPRPADEVGKLRRDRVEYGAGRGAARDVTVAGVKGGDRGLPSGGQVAMQAAAEFLRITGKRPGVGDERAAPRLLQRGPPPPA